MTLPVSRNLALDVFRGITVCFMIIVNSPGDWSIAYGPLLHASWHGFTPTDLVFPSFLFAVGNAMAFAMGKYVDQGTTAFWKKTLRRFAVIFLLGFLMYWFPFYDFSAHHFKPFSETRILGVLQRIALCYLVASILIYYLPSKVIPWISGLLLLGYWLILYVFGDPNDHYSMPGYAGNAVDFFLLGEKHMYTGEGIAFEPEGILSTLPAIVNVLAGYLTGKYLKEKGSNFETISKMLLAGAGLLLLALTWNMVFPINKKIWTSSYVLLTVGLDLVILAALVYYFDILKRKTASGFFLVFGRNPLIIYLFSEILLITLYTIPMGSGSFQQWIFKDVWGSFLSPINASLMFALSFMFVCWLFGKLLDSRKVYIKV